jgi:hypothetical protein
MRTPRPAPSAAGRAYPATGARKITRWRTCNRCSAGPNAGARTRPASRCRDVWTFSTAVVSTSTRGPVVGMPASSRSECAAASFPGPNRSGTSGGCPPVPEDHLPEPVRIAADSRPRPSLRSMHSTDPTPPDYLRAGLTLEPKPASPMTSSIIAADPCRRRGAAPTLGADNGWYPLPRVGRTLGSWAHRSSRLPCPRSRAVVGDGRPVNVGRAGQRRWRTLIRCGGRWTGPPPRAWLRPCTLRHAGMLLK